MSSEAQAVGPSAPRKWYLYYKFKCKGGNWSKDPVRIKFGKEQYWPYEDENGKWRIDSPTQEERDAVMLQMHNNCKRECCPEEITWE